MKKFIIIYFVFLFFILPLNVFAISYPEINSDTILVYDRTDDMILYENNSNTKKSIASLTKIVTTIVSIEMIDDLDENVVITSEIINSVDPVASKAGLKVGDVVTYRDLLYASILPSGADATNALGILLSGSIDLFVNEMNSLVKKLNLSDTHFVNVTGLDDDDHYSTASDICKLLNYALENDIFKEIYTTKEYTLSNGLKVYSTLYKYNGSDIDNVLGSKTGYTGNAGYCISTLSSTDGHEIILILLNAEHKNGLYYNMVDAKNIVDFIDNNYKKQLLLSKNTLITTLPVVLSDTKTYDISSNIDIYKFLSNDYDESLFNYKYEGINELNYKNKKGESIGKINYYYDGELITYENVVLDSSFKFSFLEFIKLYYYYFIIGFVIIFISLFFIINLIKKRRKLYVK